MEILINFQKKNLLIYEEVIMDTVQRFTSEFLLRKAIHMMKRKGFVIHTRSEYCGVIDVTWRKL